MVVVYEVTGDGGSGKTVSGWTLGFQHFVAKTASVDVRDDEGAYEVFGSSSVRVGIASSWGACRKRGS